MWGLVVEIECDELFLLFKSSNPNIDMWMRVVWEKGGTKREAEQDEWVLSFNKGEKDAMLTSFALLNKQYLRYNI